MNDLGLGAGLAAMAFWGFIAAVVVAGIWDGIKKRETQHETIRRMVESGQPVDPELIDQLVGRGSYRADVDLRITAFWLLPVSAAMLVFGLIMATQYPQTTAPLLGVSGMLAVMGGGFYGASRLAKKWYENDK